MTDVLAAFRVWLASHDPALSDFLVTPAGTAVWAEFARTVRLPKPLVAPTPLRVGEAPATGAAPWLWWDPTGPVPIGIWVEPDGPRGALPIPFVPAAPGWIEQVTSLRAERAAMAARDDATRLGAMFLFQWLAAVPERFLSDAAYLRALTLDNPGIALAHTQVPDPTDYPMALSRWEAPLYQLALRIDGPADVDESDGGWRHAWVRAAWGDEIAPALSKYEYADHEVGPDEPGPMPEEVVAALRAFVAHPEFHLLRLRCWAGVAEHWNAALSGVPQVEGPDYPQAHVVAERLDLRTPMGSRDLFASHKPAPAPAKSVAFQSPADPLAPIRVVLRDGKGEKLREAAGRFGYYAVGPTGTPLMNGGPRYGVIHEPTGLTLSDEDVELTRANALAMALAIYERAGNLGGTARFGVPGSIPAEDLEQLREAVTAVYRDALYLDTSLLRRAGQRFPDPEKAAEREAAKQRPKRPRLEVIVPERVASPIVDALLDPNLSMAWPMEGDVPTAGPGKRPKTQYEQQFVRYKMGLDNVSFANPEDVDAWVVERFPAAADLIPYAESYTELLTAYAIQLKEASNEEHRKAGNEDHLILEVTDALVHNYRILTRKSAWRLIRAIVQKDLEGPASDLLDSRHNVTSAKWLKKITGHVYDDLKPNTQLRAADQAAVEAEVEFRSQLAAAAKEREIIEAAERARVTFNERVMSLADYLNQQVIPFVRLFVSTGYPKKPFTSIMFGGEVSSEPNDRVEYDYIRLMLLREGRSVPTVEGRTGYLEGGPTHRIGTVGAGSRAVIVWQVSPKGIKSQAVPADRVAVHLGGYSGLDRQERQRLEKAGLPNLYNQEKILLLDPGVTLRTLEAAMVPVGPASDRNDQDDPSEAAMIAAASQDVAAAHTISSLLLEVFRKTRDFPNHPESNLLKELTRAFQTSPDVPVTMTWMQREFDRLVPLDYPPFKSEGAIQSGGAVFTPPTTHPLYPATRDAFVAKVVSEVQAAWQHRAKVVEVHNAPGAEPATPEEDSGPPGDTTWRFEIPSENVEAARHKLGILSRKAARLNVPFPEIRELEPITKHFKDSYTGAHYERQYIPFEVTDPTAAVVLDGWRFIATIDHGQDEEGKPLNLVLTSPKFGRNLPLRFRTDGPTCDHCQVTRRRNQTFVVQHNEEGFKRVGRQCLQDFVGEQSAAQILGISSLLSEVRGILEDSEGGGGGGGSADSWRFGASDILANAAWVIRNVGWVSRREARERDVMATADVVWNRVTFGLRKRVPGEEPPEPPEAEDIEAAEKTLAWARAIDPETPSDYLSNVRVVFLRGSIGYRELGLAVSAVAAWKRDRDQKQAGAAAAEGAPAPREPGQFLGPKDLRFGGSKKGSPPPIHVYILDRANSAKVGEFGPTRWFHARTAEGDDVRWFLAEKDYLEAYHPGAWVRVVGTISRLDTIQGRKVTVLNRVTLSPADGGSGGGGGAVGGGAAGGGSEPQPVTFEVSTPDGLASYQITVDGAPVGGPGAEGEAYSLSARPVTYKAGKKALGTDRWTRKWHPRFGLTGGGIGKLTDDSIRAGLEAAGHPGARASAGAGQVPTDVSMLEEGTWVQLTPKYRQRTQSAYAALHTPSRPDPRYFIGQDLPVTPIVPGEPIGILLKEGQVRGQDRWVIRFEQANGGSEVVAYQPRGGSLVGWDLDEIVVLGRIDPPAVRAAVIEGDRYADAIARVGAAAPILPQPEPAPAAPEPGDRTQPDLSVLTGRGVENMWPEVVGGMMAGPGKVIAALQFPDDWRGSLLKRRVVYGTLAKALNVGAAASETDQEMLDRVYTAIYFDPFYFPSVRAVDSPETELRQMAERSFYRVLAGETKTIREFLEGHSDVAFWSDLFTTMLTGAQERWDLRQDSRQLAPQVLIERRYPSDHPKWRAIATEVGHRLTTAAAAAVTGGPTAPAPAPAPPEPRAATVREAKAWLTEQLADAEYPYDSLRAETQPDGSVSIMVMGRLIPNPAGGTQYPHHTPTWKAVGTAIERGARAEFGKTLKIWWN